MAAHNITWDANGGTLKSGMSTSANYGYTVGVNVSMNPTRDGYTFTGWTINGEAVTLNGSYYEFTMPNEDVTLVAQWECTHDKTVHEYTYTDNGDGTHTVKCACGETINNAEAHDYTTGDAEHTCICGAVEHVCADNLTHVEAQDATCSDTGIKEHWVCSCGKLYSDDQATTEIAEADTIAPVNPDNHENLDHTDEDPATCDYSGLKEYWYCSDCDKYFEDADAQNEIEDWQAWSSEGGEGYIPATGHGKINGFGYDPNEDSINTHTVYCKDCNLDLNPAEDCVFGDDHVCDSCEQTETMTVTFMNGDSKWTETTVPYGLTLGIAGMPIPEAPAGKHFAGWYTVDNVYVVHGMTVTNNLVAYATWEDDHVCADNLTHVAAEDATCVETGIVEHWVCSCGKLYSDDQATTEIDEDDTIVDIDPTNHAGEKWFGLANDPTLEQTHHGVYCDACDEIWDEENPDEPHVAGEDGYCECGNFELCIDFNGGKISTTPPLEGLSQEVWDSLVESMFGGYEATEWCLFGIGFNKITIEDGMFVKDGYKLVGIAYDKDGTQPYNGEDITKPTTLYLIWESTHVCEHHHYEYVNTDGHQSVCSCGKAIGEAEPHSYNHTTRDFECECGAKYTGWSTSYAEDVPYTCYVKNGEVLYGWNEVEGAWYYFNTTSGNRATGLERVPYPTVEINGVKYGPNADDKAYWEAHKDTSKYSDATSAVFYFDENGKFVQYTGVEGKSYFIDGMAPWHVGFVEIDGEYYYFAGDKVNGGNVMATGKVYTTRANDTGKVNGIYNFDTDGTLIGNYYGLFEHDGAYYYRRTSTGELVTGEYYITVTNGIEGFKKGDKLVFGEDGKMLTIKEGIYEEGGKLFYYQKNRKACGAGVVELTDEDGETYYIYVRSNGELATGKYWPTTRNGLLDSGEYDWGTDGKYYPGK